MGQRVLLVEDDQTTRAGMTQLLVMEGYEVVPFENAEDAYRFVREVDGIDLAVLDVRLPGMWGDELARVIKMRLPSVGVVFVTAEKDAESRLHTRVPGCRVLPKPVDVPRLRAYLKWSHGGPAPRA